MNYYLIAPLRHNLPPLTYQSEDALKIAQVADISIRGKKTQGIVIERVEKPDFACVAARGTDAFFSESQSFLAQFITKYYCANVGVAFGLFVPVAADSPAPQNSPESPKTPQDSADSPPDSPKDSPQDSPKTLPQISPPNPLSPKQESALDFIQSHARTLLFGDTGSGKTEIYIHAALEAIKRGENVLFLMPEISLTPQMEARLRAVFGELVCIWHSKIAKPKKAQILANLGSFKIIAGARSALFLPIENLGLIIIDEEHDDAYKASSAPRYNARDLCLYLGKHRAIRVILGSATPSVTSYYHFQKSGEIFRLKGSHFAGKKRVIFENPHETISPNLLAKLAQTLEMKRQAIVFVPIRANFKSLLCRNCGQALKCKKCSVALSLHLKQRALKCHYCGYSRKVVATCPACGSDDFSALKIGTQEVAKELSAALPGARIGIFDRDEVTSDSKLKAILGRFERGEIDILVGTQMLSKGHNYRGVYLSAILGLDWLLNGGDFRALERAAALFFQIAGRCAREGDGEVFAQSANAGFFERFLDDYEDFLRFELAAREGAYPPFKRLAFLVAQNRDDRAAHAALVRCKKLVESYANIEVVGLERAPIERINGLWRYAMLLRTSHTGALLDCLSRLKTAPISIDIDPLQLL